MRWDDLRQSTNIEDVRGSTGGGAGLRLGVGGTLLALAAAYFFGVDPRLIMGLFSALPTQSSVAGAQSGTPRDEQGRFIAAVLGETEDAWGAIFQAQGLRYVPPTLVLYRGQMPSACGSANSAVGPFYCPADRKVYLDLDFYQQLADEFQAPGLFAQAYVLAHEVGHHVQNLLGILPKVQQQQRGLDRTQANQLQVRVELQADCFAGVWAFHENQRQKDRGRPPFIEHGDVEAAMRTAAAIGDDTLQRKASGHVVPDSFTHGSAEQRQRWFTTGLRQGTVGACDTFKAAGL